MIIRREKALMGGQWLWEDDGNNMGRGVVVKWTRTAMPDDGSGG